MKLKGIRLVTLAKRSQGFFIPAKYMARSIEGGYVVGKKYDLDITESEREGTQ